MNILITGGMGFLGSHIAMRHLKEGDQVDVVDDLSTSLGINSSHALELKSHEKFLFVHDDISQQDSLLTYFDPQVRGYDLIYNMACPASPPKYQAMPVHTMMTCVVGTKNVLDLARKHGSIVVHASTSEVYGDPQHNPQIETDWGNVNSYGKRSCYDEGKRAAEALCYDYRHKYGVNTKIVRIFNTFGPHMDPDDGRVVTNFIKQFLTDQDVTIYGSGEQTRSFCYVDDLVEGITRMSKTNSSITGPMNLGNPVEYTMKQLADTIKSLIPESKSKIVYCPLPSDDPRQRKPDITAATRDLEWYPNVTLIEGLLKTISYMKTIRQYFDRSWFPCHRM